ncbi:unnamed protein product, partial [marine sediment metagenome]
MPSAQIVKGEAKMIEVKKKNSEEFAVTVKEGDTKTEHTVTLDDRYYRDLTQGNITK